MTAPDMPPRPREPEHRAAMLLLASLLEQRTGQQLAPSRAWRLDTTLTPLLRERGLETLDQLVLELMDARDPDLSKLVVDALLNQETSFFRDASVIDAAIQALLAMRADRPGARLRVWAAGCSTGQEPLSLAMLLEESGAFGATHFPEIVATDVSDAALARGRTGRYSQFEVQRGLPIRRLIQYFEPAGPDWIARQSLVRRVSFRRHNLVADPMPAGQFDVVLCRNVLLYFSPAQRRRVFDRLAGAVRPGGLLVLGAGETVIGQTDAFVPSEAHRGFYRPAGPPTPRAVAAKG